MDPDLQSSISDQQSAIARSSALVTFREPAEPPLETCPPQALPIARINPDRLSSFQLRTYSRLLIAHRFNLLGKIGGLLDSLEENAQAMENIQELLLEEDRLTQRNAQEMTTRQVRLTLEGYLGGKGAR